MNKPFDPALYAENNLSTMLIAKEILEQLTDSIVTFPEKEQYKSHDCIMTGADGETKKVEVERKKVWTKSGEWQGWSTVDVPARKSESKADWYILVNFPGDSALIIPMLRVLESPQITKDTIYTKREKFFRVPVEKFTMVVKENGVWD